MPLATEEMIRRVMPRQGILDAPPPRTPPFAGYRSPRPRRWIWLDVSANHDEEVFDDPFRFDVC